MAFKISAAVAVCTSTNVLLTDAVTPAASCVPKMMGCRAGYDHTPHGTPEILITFTVSSRLIL